MDASSLLGNVLQLQLGRPPQCSNISRHPRQMLARNMGHAWSDLKQGKRYNILCYSRLVVFCDDVQSGQQIPPCQSWVDLLGTFFHV